MNALLSVYCYFSSLFSQEEGQDLIEYALIAGLIALIAVAAITTVGTNVGTIWSNLSGKVAAAAGAGS